MKIGISLMDTESRGRRARGSARELSVGFNQFGLDLQRLLPPHTNTFFSPLSICAALTALVPGARGRTAAEITAMLGLPADLDGVRNGIDEMTRRVSLATALFVAEAYPLHTSFCDALTNAFGAEFFSQSFDDPAIAASRINSWVSDRTHGRIPHLLDPESLDPDTRLVLANAVYFKASWLHQFMEDATGPRPFFLRSGERIEVPTMRQQTHFAYGSDEELGYEAIDLPYEHGTSMLVILPESGRFDEVGASLSSEFLAGADSGMKQRDVDLRLPRFELRFATPLAELLQALGMKEAFDSKLSDLSGLTPSSEPLVISEVIHQAWVKTDENGTEAAAAMAITALAAGADWEPPPPIPLFVDRPFYFFIRDHKTGGILFQGRVMDPRG